MAKETSGHFRSAVSGQYVTNGYGKSHPATTVREASGPHGSSGPHYRSAKTGEYVATDYGKSHPKTTVKNS